MTGIGCDFSCWQPLFTGTTASFAVIIRAIETDLTLSEEQLKVAQERAADCNLQDKVKFKLLDYRNESNLYDRIVSVGMFEHVGRPNYICYFKQMQQCLADDGIALLHTIGRTGEPANTNPWITKYIFPGGYVPALSEINYSVEKTDLMITDVEVLRQHYNQTVAAWRQRFLSHRHKFAQLKSERFCRIWEFYLAISEVVFVHSDTVVFQLQFSKQHGSVPITRDYLYDSAEPYRECYQRLIPDLMRLSETIPSSVISNATPRE